MCRYSGFPYREYRQHFACLPCRFAARYGNEHGSVVAALCPICGQQMTSMGRDFKAPKRGNANQWRKLEILVAKQLLFHSCGCTGPGPRPRTLAEAKMLT